MKTFHLIITKSAQIDIEEIYNYITYTLLAPENASKQVNRIFKELKNLQTLPNRHPLHSKEPWKSQGLRKVIIDNFLAFYLVNEQTEEVIILHVYYCGRNVDELLK